MSDQTPTTVEVDNLNQFVALLTKWHQNRVAQLEHLLEIPEGTEAQLNDTVSVVLNGDVRTGFLIGVTLGLAQLGKLPFVAEVTEDDMAIATKEDTPAEAAQ